MGLYSSTTWPAVFYTKNSVCTLVKSGKIFFSCVANCFLLDVFPTSAVSITASEQEHALKVPFRCDISKMTHRTNPSGRSVSLSRIDLLLIVFRLVRVGRGNWQSHNECAVSAVVCWREIIADSWGFWMNIFWGQNWHRRIWWSWIKDITTREKNM